MNEQRESEGVSAHPLSEDRAVVNGATSVSAVPASVPCGEKLIAFKNESQIDVGQWSIGIENKYGVHGINDVNSDRYLLVSGYCYEEDALKMAAAREMFAALQHILDGALSLPRFAEDEGRAALRKARGQA